METILNRISQPEVVIDSGRESPLPYLREVTAEQHRGLENHLNLLRPNFALDDYVAILKKFYGFWRPWEVRVAYALTASYETFFARRRRSGAIERDLQNLGLRPPDFEHLPRAHDFPALDTIDAALGSMYVIEGSTLGGQLLSRHFMATVGVLPDQCSFFRGYGSETGWMWKQFELELAKRPRSSYPAMADAAVETFRSLRRWL